MNIQMVDLKRQYDQLRIEIDSAIMQVLESSKFINGPDVHALAREIETFLQVKYAIPCASGTDALQLSLMAIDLQPGDEVITTPFTFIATAETIALLGGKPVFVDIDERTFNIRPDLIEKAITPRTRAIIPVHLYGQAADMEPILDIAKKHHLTVIEDAAQALGAKYKNQKVGTLGDIACISFFPSKNLGAYGDAGMVVTNQEELAEKIRMIANHGSRKRYYHEMLGVNSRLDSLQAAILRVKLKHLDTWNEQRKKNAQFYIENLQLKEIQTPYVEKFNEHIFHQFTIRAQKRDELREYLAHKVIPTAIHYPIPLHLQPAFKNRFGFKEGEFPAAERAAREVISLPMHPDLTREEQEYICDAIKTFYQP